MAPSFFVTREGTAGFFTLIGLHGDRDGKIYFWMTKITRPHSSRGRLNGAPGLRQPSTRSGEKRHNQRWAFGWMRIFDPTSDLCRFSRA
jgi:hypothetical protein